MSKTIKCDVCFKDIDVMTYYDQIINGEGKQQINIMTKKNENLEFDLLIHAVSLSGDRIELDICADCMKKGGAGFSGGQ